MNEIEDASAMNDEDTDKSHTMTWGMWVLALPVLYLLSAPPVVITAVRLTTPIAYVGLGSGAIAPGPPPWLIAFAAPYTWLCEETALRVPLQRYAEFWRALVMP